MSVSLQDPHDLSLARMVAQRLVVPLASPVDVVAHLGCVQGQDLPGALASIALRTSSRSLDEVVAAFDDGHLVRTWTMRGTLHVVGAADLRWILGLTGARMFRAGARRREQLGIDDGLLEAAHDVVVRRLAGGGRATRTELLAALDDAGLLAGVAQRGYHLLSSLALHQVVVQGPMARTRTGRIEQQFVLVDEWVADATPPDDCVAVWAGTYLAGHGPASLADLVRWTGLTRTACRVGIAGAPRLEQVEVGGDVLHHARGLPEQLAGRRADAQRLVLLPGFDELVLGYADRSCTVRPEHAAAIVPGNNGMFKATVVDGGQVVGTWRRPTRAGALPVVDWFSPPTTSQLDALAEAWQRMPR